MIVTEAEARTKRCQESFGDTNVTPGGDVYFAHIAYGTSATVSTSPSFCIGSACMAWEWMEDTKHGREVSKLGYCGKVRRR